MLISLSQPAVLEAGLNSIIFRDYRLDTVADKGYTAIEQLASTVLLNYDPEGRFMAMLAAYFDESGIHSDSSVVAVAGYVAPVNEWQKLELEWRFFLRD